MHKWSCMRGVASNTTFPKHFDGKRFYNPGGTPPKGWIDALRWKLTTRPEPAPRFIADVKQSIPARRVERGELRVTFVNHSTVLLQQGRLNILTDPIWSERASPFSWIGPRRRRKPGVRIEDLPPIDIVLISHNHYDHLDVPTLRRMRVPKDCVFVAPLGVSRLLRSEGDRKTYELDWGDAQKIAEITIHCVPAAHFGGRRLLDRNRSLWCGYVIEFENQFIYFAGDTGFGDHFASVQQRFGALRLSLLPIGAYLPRWFMEPC